MTTPKKSVVPASRAPFNAVGATCLLASLVSCSTCSKAHDDPLPKEHTVTRDASLVDANVETGCGACDAYTDFEMTGTIAYDIPELSGLAASHVHERAFYAHQDSGDTARFFAIDDDGRSRGEFDLPSATAVDWEDIATGPCPGGGASCIFLGDIGDNLAIRSTYDIYVVHEPALDPPGGKASVTFDQIRFVYPDGAHNAETLLAHPKTGDVYVVTKETTGHSGLYQVPKPFTFDATTTLTKVLDLDVPSGTSREFTGGDIHPCAPRVILRTYTNYYEYRGKEGEPFASIFANPPLSLYVHGELQGEAIAYAANGRMLLSSAETQKVPPTLSQSTCAK